MTRDDLKGQVQSVDWRRRIDEELPFQYKEARQTTPVQETTNVKSLVSYETGCIRDAADLRYVLVPKRGLRRVALTAREGEHKYGQANWEKGIPIKDCLEHAINHIFAYISGDRSEDHLGHAAWNLMAACDSEERWPELNKEFQEALARDPFNDLTGVPEYVMKALQEALQKAPRHSS